MLQVIRRTCQKFLCSAISRLDIFLCISDESRNIPWYKFNVGCWSIIVHVMWCTHMFYSDLAVSGHMAYTLCVQCFLAWQLSTMNASLANNNNIRIFVYILYIYMCMDWTGNLCFMCMCIISSRRCNLHICKAHKLYKEKQHIKSLDVSFSVIDRTERWLFGMILALESSSSIQTMNDRSSLPHPSIQLENKSLRTTLLQVKGCSNVTLYPIGTPLFLQTGWCPCYCKKPGYCSDTHNRANQ
jgi:hypothetical protein